MGLTHDSALTVELYGGKEWVAWIIDRLKAGRQIGGCRNCHRDTVLQGMTNQFPGNRAEDWIAWWARNKDKTQIEWIRDGFAARGIALHDPLTQDDVAALLLVMEVKDPREFRFNAERLLRDSGFCFRGDFDVSKVPADKRDEVIAALMRYADWLRFSADPIAPGRLVRRDEGGASPDYCSTRYALGAYSLMGILFLAGTFCVWQYARLRRRVVQRGSSAPGASASQDGPVS